MISDLLMTFIFLAPVQYAKYMSFYCLFPLWVFQFAFNMNVFEFAAGLTRDTRFVYFNFYTLCDKNYCLLQEMLIFYCNLYCFVAKA